MYWLLSPRVLIAIALVGILSFTHFAAYRGGKAAVRAEWDKDIAVRAEAALKAEQAARAKEQALTQARQQTEVKYVEEKRKAAAAAAAAKSDLDRLRDTLAAPGGETCRDPGAASRVAGASRLESELLGHCAQALTDLAAEADRLEARIVGLQAYVKDVCLAK
jgi:hypothetical protein